MSADFGYTAERIMDMPAPDASRPLIGRGLKRFMLITSFVIGLELAWLFVVSPCLPFSTVEVNAFPGIERSWVLNLAGIDASSSWFSVDAGKAEASLESFYQIERARVIKRFPDRVKVYVTPKTPAAMTLLPVNGRVTPVYFDRNGVIFKMGNGGMPVEEVPIISGVVIENPHLGMRLPAPFCPLLAQLEKIRSDAPELLGAVSEIKINRKPFDGFDLILYPVHNPVKVRLEPDLNEEILRYVMLMIDVFVSRHTALEDLDFRTGIASYSLKEAPPGE
jgi:cell division protein FtsQ